MIWNDLPRKIPVSHGVATSTPVTYVHLHRPNGGLAPAPTNGDQRSLAEA